MYYTIKMLYIMLYNDNRVIIFKNIKNDKLYFQYKNIKSKTLMIYKSL